MEQKFIVRTEGDKVVIIHNGKRIAEMPWDKGIEFSKAIRIKAKDAEEYAKVNNVIEDGAVLLRLGIPIGLSDDPRVKDEIKKMASWDSKIRRHFPNNMGNIKSKEVFGRPGLRGVPNGKPKNNQ